MSASRIIDNQPGRVGRWVIERTGGIYSKTDSSAIGLEKDGKLIAGTLYTGFNGQSVAMHIACDGSLTREFIWFCFYYAFEQLNVKKVLGLVESTHHKALELDKRLGFVHEHTIKDGGRENDLIILSMTKAQCRWLNAVKRAGVNDGWKIQLA